MFPTETRGGSARLINHEPLANGLLMCLGGRGKKPKIFYPILLRPVALSSYTEDGKWGCAGFARKGTGYRWQNMIVVDYRSDDGLIYGEMAAPTIESAYQLLKHLGETYG